MLKQIKNHPAALGPLPGDRPDKDQPEKRTGETSSEGS